MRYWLGIALLLMSPPAFAEETALEVQSWCKEITSSRIRDSKIEMRQTFENGFCWGAFTMFEGLYSVLDENGVSLFKFCPPSGVSRLQIINIFVNYTSQHPEVLHQSFVQVTLNAFHYAFPCPKP
jgi:hypothetical protein